MGESLPTTKYCGNTTAKLMGVKSLLGLYFTRAGLSSGFTLSDKVLTRMV